MSTNKQSAGVKSVQIENQTALKVFKSAKVKATVKAIAAAKQDGDTADASRATHAMTFMQLAAAFIADANGKGVTDSGTQSANWVSNIKLMAEQLKAEGHACAEALTDKDGNVTGHKLVGYPANVASIAKGVVEYGIDITDVPRKDDKVDISYRDVATAVKLERASRRPTEVIALAEAKAAALDAFGDLLEVVSQDDDVPLINTLTDSLIAMKEQALEDLAIIATLESQAKKAAEVVNIDPGSEDDATDDGLPEADAVAAA